MHNISVMCSSNVGGKYVQMVSNLAKPISKIMCECRGWSRVTGILIYLCEEACILIIAFTSQMTRSFNLQ